MDAQFLATELRILGRTAEAAQFWSAYDTEFRGRFFPRVAAHEHAALSQSIYVMDLVSEFYRANIFYRLARAGVNPERADPAWELMENCVARMSSP